MNGYTKNMQRQQGVVLFVSLIMLVVIGMLSLSLMGISRIELRMANNEEARVSSLQLAQSLSDVIVATPALTPVIGVAGHKNCAGAIEGCDMYMNDDLPDNEIAQAVQSGYLTASATRSTPEFRPPPRGLGWSSSKFIATSFHLEATFDRTEEGLGHGSVQEGVVVMIPLN